MNKILRLKKENELLRVKAAKGSLEIKVAEYLDEIERLKENIIIQDEKIMELDSILNGE